MEFSSARAIEQIVWQMRLADYPRSSDRARIDSLANGAPPYPADEAERSGVEVNVNDLTLTRLSHDARMQLYQAFCKPGNFFTMRTDMGTVSKRQERGIIATSLVNRYMKRSDPYYQLTLSQFAGMVLHGIGPGSWEHSDKWCPTALSIADVMIPSKTLLTFENLPFFAIFRPYSPHQLQKMTRDPKRNPGWNMQVVKAVLKWADEQTSKLYGGTSWSEYWVPEKTESRYKEDSGIYASDLVQTIDCWDFYYWDDAGKHEGWRRRIVLDAEGGSGRWGSPGGYGPSKQLPDKNLMGERGQFLYSSGDRVVADNINQIIHFQFADLSAVPPFKYHSVRSLGFMLYAACHLQNRLRCSFSEAVFEGLMNYMRVNSLDEAERALKIELANRGIIDETVRFLPPQERWQVNPALAELGLNEFKQIISDNSSSYTQNQNFSRDRVEKTKFQVMAEVNAMTTLVSSALQQAYRYQTSQYREIVRRFLKKDSQDPDVRDFRAKALQRGIPEKLLVPDAWEIESERILGAGNKTLEMAIAQQLMEWRAAFPPQAQQEILRKATLAITDDASEALALVPHSPGLPDARHDAMVAFGSLMAGAIVQFRADQNRLEVAQTLLVELDLAVNKVSQTGALPSIDKVSGMQNVIAHIGQLVESLAADPEMKDTVRKLAQASGRLANTVKSFEQEVMKAQQEQAQAGQGAEAQVEMAKALAKVEADRIVTGAKAANTRESHAQRTAQRQAQHELQMENKAQDARLNLEVKAAESTMNLQAERERLEIEKERAKAKPAPSASKE